MSAPAPFHPMRQIRPSLGVQAPPSPQVLGFDSDDDFSNLNSTFATSGGLMPFDEDIIKESSAGLLAPSPLALTSPASRGVNDNSSRNVSIPNRPPGPVHRSIIPPAGPVPRSVMAPVGHIGHSTPTEVTSNALFSGYGVPQHLPARKPAMRPQPLLPPSVPSRPMQQIPSPMSRIVPNVPSRPGRPSLPTRPMRQSSPMDRHPSIPYRPPVDRPPSRSQWAARPVPRRPSRPAPIRRGIAASPAAGSFPGNDESQVVESASPPFAPRSPRYSPPQPSPSPSLNKPSPWPPQQVSTAEIHLPENITVKPDSLKQTPLITYSPSQNRPSPRTMSNPERCALDNDNFIPDSRQETPSRIHFPPQIRPPFQPPRIMSNAENLSPSSPQQTSPRTCSPSQPTRSPQLIPSSEPMKLDDSKLSSSQSPHSGSPPPGSQSNRRNPLHSPSPNRSSADVGETIHHSHPSWLEREPQHSTKRTTTARPQSLDLSDQLISDERRQFLIEKARLMGKRHEDEVDSLKQQIQKLKASLRVPAPAPSELISAPLSFDDCLPYAYTENSRLIRRALDEQLDNNARLEALLAKVTFVLEMGIFPKAYAERIEKAVDSRQVQSLQEDLHLAQIRIDELVNENAHLSRLLKMKEERIESVQEESRVLIDSLRKSLEEETSERKRANALQS